MNYRHAFHAGNFADVVKHLSLTAVLLHLRRKESPFVVIDSHAGRGAYDLTGDEARRTGEAESGIVRLQTLSDGVPTLATYLEVVRKTARYPGSPLIAANLLRLQDRLVAIEKHPEDAAALADVLRPFRKTRVAAADGYERLPALLPPPERRGVILIDPPYEADDEFVRAAASFDDAFGRFATGIYIVWFPIKSASAADAFCGEVLASGPRSALRLDIMLGEPSAERLRAAGLLIVNPPYLFEEEMQAALRPVLPLLGAEARFRQLASG